MGGLVITPNIPGPKYDFEMVHAETGELYLHQKVGLFVFCPVLLHM